MRRARTWLASALLCALAGLAEGQETERTLVKVDKSGPSRVQIRFDEVGALVSQESDWESAFEVVAIDAPETPLRLVAKTKSDETAADLGLDDEPVVAGLTLFPTVELELAEPLAADKEHAVRIAGGVFRVLREGKLVTYPGGLEPVGTVPWVADVADLLTSAQQTRDDNGFSLGAGDQQGVFSFHYRKHLTGFGNGLWNLEASLDGDITLDQSQRFDYFNQVSARVQGYRGFRYDAGKQAYGEAGLHYEFQSDQKLENADHKLGVQFATVIKDPVTSAISDALRPPGEASNVPLWVLGLDYVDEALSDSDSAPQKPDTENGDFRAELNLDWRMAVGRKLEWDFLPSIGTIRKVDLLIAGDLVWDPEEDELYDSSRVTLRLTPDATVAGTSTAIDLSWARGEPGPVFEEFSALLLGLRIGR